MGKELWVRVPASSANLGPGFDALSIAIGKYLEATVSFDQPGQSDGQSTKRESLQLVYEGVNADSVDVNVDANLITKTIQQVLRQYHKDIPAMLVSVKNDIPLAKGLGSSAAAVIAGCVIANEVGSLGLDRGSLLTAALAIEPHPDNIAAALYGGFVVSCVNPEDHQCHAISTPVSSQIQATIVVPDIAKKSTAEARAVLPPSYTRAQAVFNIQRASLLTSLLSNPTVPSHITNVFDLAMQDQIHQPYRQQLVPGLDSVLELKAFVKAAQPPLSPSLSSSFLGTCMSGAGPSVLGLSLAGHDEDRRLIANLIKDCFAKHNVSSVPFYVEIDNTGTVWEWR